MLLGLKRSKSYPYVIHFCFSTLFISVCRDSGNDIELYGCFCSLVHGTFRPADC